MRIKKFLLIPVLLLSITASLFSQMNFSTNAMGGIFGEDQNPSFFAINGTGWIRLLVDYREIYRGRGPAIAEMNVRAEQARAFILTAEYYSHIDELLESYSYYIYIDKITPPQPVLEFRNSNSGLSFIQTEGKQYTGVRAFADLGESLYFFDNLRRVDAAPPVSFPAIIWAEDWAGNISEPRQEFFEISLIKIANPISGSFRNSQTLIITGIESEYVFWTIDGTYPLAHDGTGMLYRGPVRIDAHGDINLRIAWLDRSGRPREDRVSYSVAPNGGRNAGMAGSGGIAEGSGMAEGGLEHFYRQEEIIITSNTSLRIPDSWLWSINDSPPENSVSVLANRELVLRPQNLITRAIGVNLLDPEGRLYRFAYLLDGGSNNPLASRELYNTLPEIMFYSGYLMDFPVFNDDMPFRDPDYLYPLLRYLSAGRSRLLIWPEEIQGTIYFSWGDSWFSGNRPLPIPLEGGRLTWFVFIDEDTYYGPFSNEIDPLPIDRSMTRGRIAYKNNLTSDQDQGWNYVSHIIPYSPGIIRNSNFNICDGEDLDWAFISIGGNILEELHIDRLPPTEPILHGFPVGGWTRGPLRIDLETTEDRARGYINVRLVYPSGEVEILSGNEYLIINSSLDQIAEVYVTAFQIDASGNRGPSVELFFILDPKTIYVSPVPLMPVSNPRAPLGGMDNPFTSLDDALSHAQRQGLTDIRVYGSLELKRPLRVFSMLNIDGGWRTPEENDSYGYGSLIITSDDFYWDLFPGSVLELNGVRILRGSGNARLVNMNDAVLLINNSHITIISDETDRNPSFSAINSVIEVSNTRIHVLGDYTLMFNIQGGSIYTSYTTFLSSGERTAAIFNLERSRGSFYGFIFRSLGEDYASVVEAEDAELLLDGGSLSASARDANILFLDHSIAAIMDSRFELDALFSARAVNLTDSPFPLVRNSIFISGSNAQRSEVFSRNETVSREYLENERNEFHGFTHFMPGTPFE